MHQPSDKQKLWYKPMIQDKRTWLILWLHHLLFVATHPPWIGLSTLHHWHDGLHWMVAAALAKPLVDALPCHGTVEWATVGLCCFPPTVIDSIVVHIVGSRHLTHAGLGFIAYSVAVSASWIITAIVFNQKLVTWLVRCRAKSEFKSELLAFAGGCQQSFIFYWKPPSSRDYYFDSRHH